MTPKRRAPNPSMADPADRDVHRGKSTKSAPVDDLADPADAESDAPHDRGVVRGQTLEGAREDMVERLGRDKDAWRKGRTQNR